VSCRLTLQLLNFTIVIAAPHCSVGVIVGVVDDVGNVGDMVNAKEASRVGISDVVMDMTD
jgi:hypothetical protein